jgi:hypothetical protein
MGVQKVHLKRSPGDRLALCGIWPQRNFVAIEEPRQAIARVCEICLNIAKRDYLPSDPATKDP